MGGKVPDSMKSSQNNSLPSNTMVTDDEIGNGESIFDFKLNEENEYMMKYL